MQFQSYFNDEVCCLAPTCANKLAPKAPNYVSMAHLLFGCFAAMESFSIFLQQTATL